MKYIALTGQFNKCKDNGITFTNNGVLQLGCIWHLRSSVVALFIISFLINFLTLWPLLKG